MITCTWVKKGSKGYAVIAISNMVRRKKRSLIYGFANKVNSFLLLVQSFPQHNPISSVWNWNFVYLQNRRLLAHNDCQVLASAIYILTIPPARNKVIRETACKSSSLNMFPFWTLEQASYLSLHILGKLQMQRNLWLRQRNASPCHRRCFFGFQPSQCERQRSLWNNTLFCQPPETSFIAVNTKLLLNKIYTWGFIKHNLFFSVFTSSFENVQILSFTSKVPFINSSGTSHIGDALYVYSVMD